MKEENLMAEDGSNGDLEDANPLSIDTGEPDESRPTIRINKGIQNQAELSLKRKAENGLSQIVRKVRPTNSENESDINTLEKEIRALHWLARRKEQEWDQVIRLLKQKEEKLLQSQRNRVLIKADSDHILSRPLVVPKRSTLVISNPIKVAASPVVSASPTILSAPAVQQNNTTAAAAAAAISESALKKATENLEKEGGGKEKAKTPVCQGCKVKKSEFVCAGCSNRWYCSRECQVEDWDDHADECSG